MATAKKSAKKTGRKSAKSSARKTPAKKRAARKSSSSVRKGVKTSSSTARKTGVSRTNVTQYKQKKTSTGTKRTKMAPGEAKSKKESLIKQKRSTGSGPACWPGFERVPGKTPGTKGSCKPKPNQSQGEKKEDSREAAGAKLRKAGGNKARANHSR